MQVIDNARQKYKEAFDAPYRSAKPQPVHRRGASAGVQADRLRWEERLPEQGRREEDQRDLDINRRACLLFVLFAYVGSTIDARLH